MKLAHIMLMIAKKEKKFILHSISEVIPCMISFFQITQHTESQCVCKKSNPNLLRNCSVEAGSALKHTKFHSAEGTKYGSGKGEKS